MGIMAYGKSRSNNYLEQKCINNYDASTYMLVKTELEPIISEADFYKVQEIKVRRIKPSLCKAIDNRKKIATYGVRENKDLWGSKLQCGCGASFKKNRWHKNKGKPKRANVGGMLVQIERLKQKKDTLTEMRIEGEITKEEYKEQKEKVDREIKELEAEYQKQIAEAENAEEQDVCWDKITEVLE